MEHNIKQGKLHKKAEFLGNTLAVIKSFPDTAKQRIGYEIHRLQCGEQPTAFKPIKTVRASVYEICIDADDSWFRVFYVAKFSDAIYILHAFRKKQNKTPPNAIDTGKSVYKELIRNMQMKSRSK